MLYQWKVLSFGLATAHRVFTSLPKPVLFLCQNKNFCIDICCNHILVLVHPKWARKRAWSLLCSLLVFLELHMNFFHVWPFPHSNILCFWHVLGYFPYVSFFFKFNILLFPCLLQTQPITVCQVIFFLGKASFCASGHSQLWQLFVSFRMTCWLFIILQPNYFLVWTSPFQLCIS